MYVTVYVEGVSAGAFGDGVSGVSWKAGSLNETQKPIGLTRQRVALKCNTKRIKSTTCLLNCLHWLSKHFETL